MDTPINNAKGFSAAIRTAHWWQYKAAPLMGFVYIFIYTNSIPLLDASIGIIMSVITIMGIAGIGYVINDLYDIEFDKMAGKPNRIGSLSLVQLVALILVLLLAAFLPWLWLPFDNVTLALIVFQFALYLMYSHPLIRFKEKHFFGIICDALYGHVVPSSLAMYTFHKMNSSAAGFPNFSLFMLASFLWLFFKGVHNIIIHQIEDRKNDRVAHLNTFALWYGPLPTLQLMNKIVMPLELFFLGIWLACLSINIPMFAVIPSFFLLISYFKFSGWSLAYMPQRQSWFKFMHFLNDLYEDWLPLLAVILLVFADARMVVFVIVHLLLFPGLVFKLLNDVKLSFQNMKKGRITEQERIVIK